MYDRTGFYRGRLPPLGPRHVVRLGVRRPAFVIGSSIRRRVRRMPDPTTNVRSDENGGAGALSKLCMVGGHHLRGTIISESPLQDSKFMREFSRESAVSWVNAYGEAWR